MDEDRAALRSLYLSNFLVGLTLVLELVLLSMEFEDSSWELLTFFALVEDDDEAVRLA